MLTKKLIYHIIILLSFPIFLTSCTPSQVSLKRSIDLTDKFESYTVLQDYNYYYTGPEAAPDAIIGIRDGLTIKTTYWKPIKVDEKQLRDWGVMFGSYRSSRSSNAYYASYIVDRDGTDIGIWYGYIDKPTIIKTGDKSYNIYPPESRFLSNHIRYRFN